MLNITELLTYEEARQMLGFCRKKFKEMRDNGFPQVQVSKNPKVRTKILKRDVEDYLKEHELEK